MPKSFPPMLTVTTEVFSVTAASWLARTSRVVAPEQLTSRSLKPSWRATSEG